MAIEDTVFLRSTPGETGSAVCAVLDSFGALLLFRDSQEKGLVSLRGGGGGIGSAACATGGCGGGDHGTVGSAPVKPCRVFFGGSLGGRSGLPSSPKTLLSALVPTGIAKSAAV